MEYFGTEPETEKFVLGFDDSCPTCTGLAQRLWTPSEGQLSVLPLASPQMRHWRESALGDEAPWLPTLVRVRGGDVHAWTGWRIAPVLSRHLGPQKTWRILGVLGSHALEGRPGSRSRAMARRTFLRTAIGSVAAISLLGSSGIQKRPALAMDGYGDAGGDASVADGLEVEWLEGEDLIEEALSHLSRPDVATMAGPAVLAPAAAGAGVPTAVGPERLRPISSESGSQPPPAGEVEVAAGRRTLPNGKVASHVVAFQYDSSQVLLSVRFSAPVEDLRSLVARYQYVPNDGDALGFRHVETHMNGEPLESLEKGTDLSTMVDDPCGGCWGGPGSTTRYLTTDLCSFSGSVLSCLSGMAACSMCFTPPPSGTGACLTPVSALACGVCLLVTCTAGVLLACCGGETNPYCALCGANM